MNNMYCENCSYEFDEQEVEFDEDLGEDCCPNCGDNNIHDLNNELI